MHQVPRTCGNTLVLPIAIETAGTWDKRAMELIEEIGRRCTIETRRFPRNLRLGGVPYLQRGVEKKISEKMIFFN